MGGVSVAVGRYSGYEYQGEGAIAVGNGAAYTNQGQYAIAIGCNAGYSYQPDNSIVLSATGSALNVTNSNAFYVKPIRQLSDLTGFTGLYYNPSTGEIAYM